MQYADFTAADPGTFSGKHLRIGSTRVCTDLSGMGSAEPVSYTHRLQPVQTADKRTFAGTGRADDSDHFTFVDIDVNAV